MKRGHNIPALQTTNITVDFTKHWPLRFQAWLPTRELGQVVDKFIRDLKIQDGSKDDGRQEVDFPNNTCALETFSVYMDAVVLCWRRQKQNWHCDFCVLYFIAFLCDFVTVTLYEYKPTCLGLISVLFKGNKWQKASVSNHSCYLIRIAVFHCTESMRVIGYGYFLAFLATFLTLLFEGNGEAGR